MEKPRVYIETSILSYLTARPSADIRIAANQYTTHQWWEKRRPGFDLYVSQYVIGEAGLGDPDAAARRLGAMSGLRSLDSSDDVEAIARELMTSGPLPAKAELDALHIAIAALHAMDYLMTWNCSHIANAAMRHKIEVICRRMNCEPPIICTPQELMED